MALSLISSAPATLSRTGDRTALITGSTSGIGRGIAKACARTGYNIVLNGFGNPDEIRALKTDLASEYNVEVDYSPADLTRGEQVESLIANAVHRFGKIDLLVNNAGFFHVDRIEAVSNADWDRTLSINLTAAFKTIRSALPGMKQRNCGRIVNIASALGLVGQIACAPYAATKHAIIGLTRSVALETAEHGITVNAICPGYVRTPLVESEIRSMAQTRGLSEDAAAAEIVAAAHPAKRFVSPDEIADLVVFLASDSAASITGAALAVDGGWTAR